MNFKTLNMKKGLPKIWIIGSVFWFLFPFFRYWDSPDGGTPLGLAITGVVSVGLWWALFYLAFWVARGFVDDDDKKAGF